MKIKCNPWLWASLVLMLLGTYGSSCKKTNDGDPNKPPAEGVQKPVGKSLSDPYVEIVGPEGGVVVSPDERVQLIIPEGALTQYTEIGIELIENTSPGALGLGVRLTPHGTTFKKPVKLKLSYDGLLEEGASPDVLAIATQDDKGVWKALKGAILDASTQTVTIETTHFSDWSFIQSLTLIPKVATIKPGQQVEFEALTLLGEIELAPLSNDDYLAPLINDATVTDPKTSKKYQVTKWYVSGPGAISALGNKAVYTAANTEGTAYVTAELMIEGKKILLIAPVVVMDEGFQWRINGGAWVKFQGAAAKLPDGTFTIGNLALTTNVPQIKILWKGSATTTLPWSMDESSAIFQATLPNLTDFYTCWYDVSPTEKRVSRGNLQVTEAMSNNKTYLVGKAKVAPSGVYPIYQDEMTGTNTIEMTFKVLRSW